jgi:phage tail sheath protein FI
MPVIEQFVHNGASIVRDPAPTPMGPLGRAVFGLVGTAPDAHPDIPRSKAFWVNNKMALAKLDVAGHERGTLWRACKAMLDAAQCSIYVIIEDEDNTTAPADKDYQGTIVTAKANDNGSLAITLDDPTLLDAVVGAQAASWSAEIGGKRSGMVSYLPGETNILTIKGDGAIKLADLVAGSKIVIHGKDLTAAGTIAKIVGGIDPLTGRRTGIEALAADIPETLTDIAAPGFNHKAVHDALAKIAKRLFAAPALEGPSTTDEAAIALSQSLGVVDTGYADAVLVDPFVKVWSNAAKGYVYMSGVAHYLSCVARVDVHEAPGKGRMNVYIDGCQRTIDYNLLDKSSGGDRLNKYGVTYFGRTSRGGFSLLGNRTLDGSFINKRRLELAIIRKLIATTEPGMAQNLSKEFMQSKVASLQNWLDGEAAAGKLIGAKVYLHPTLNTVENYNNGEWHIVIGYAGYSPNEHMVYHLREDEGIVESFLNEVL